MLPSALPARELDGVERRATSLGTLPGIGRGSGFAGFVQINGLGRMEEKRGGMMAKKRVEAEPEPVTEAVVKKPCILVEEPTGGAPYELEVPEAVGLERAVTVNGVRFEHCSEVVGVWVYRQMEK